VNTLAKMPGVHKKQTPPALKMRADTEVKTGEHPHKKGRGLTMQTPPVLKTRTDAEVKTSKHHRRTPGAHKGKPHPLLR
jgi:hypothetical protein